MVEVKQISQRQSIPKESIRSDAKMIYSEIAEFLEKREAASISKCNVTVKQE